MCEELQKRVRIVVVESRSPGYSHEQSNSPGDSASISAAGQSIIVLVVEELLVDSKLAGQEARMYEVTSASLRRHLGARFE